MHAEAPHPPHGSPFGAGRAGAPSRSAGSPGRAPRRGPFGAEHVGSKPQEGVCWAERLGRTLPHFSLLPDDAMRIDPAVLAELDKTKLEVGELLPKLGKGKIRELKNMITKYQEARFRLKHRPPKYGSLNKGFNDAELRSFFFAIDKPKYRLLFGYMAYLGLRIGEAVRVNVKDINLEAREIRIKSEKTNKLDLLLMPMGLFDETREFMEQHKEEIDAADGYLFFKDYNKDARQEQFIESNYVRKLFRSYVIEAGLDETYDVSEETKGRAVRQLHRLTTHSLRHYAISHFAKETNGNLILASKFARHLKPETTTIYIHTEKEELYRQIEKAFSGTIKINHVLPKLEHNFI